MSDARKKPSKRTRGGSGAKPGSAARKAARGGSEQVSVPDPGGEQAREISVQVPRGGKRVKQVSSEVKKEAAHHVQVLEKNAQVSRDGNLLEGQTHAIETDESGNRALIRKRFSAL